MKRFILAVIGVVAGQFLIMPDAVAFPGERIPYRAAHFARKVAYKIDHHVVHPAHRVVVRHLGD